MMQIVLHLGAHKTATTHLQQALKRSRAALTDRETALFLPDDLRRNGLMLQDWLGQSSTDPEHEAILRAAFARPARRLLISEENAIGMVPGPSLTRDGLLYARAGQRLARLRRVLPEAPVTLALAVREGAGFLASCHVQALMAGRVAPFAQVFGGIDPAGLDWAGLADRLLSAWPGARLLVWDHADWPAVADQVAAALLGPGARAPDWPRGLSHPGLSAPAVARLLAEAPPDPGAARDLARRLRRDLGKEAGHPPYDPWPAEYRLRATAALKRDLAALDRRPDTRVIRPEAG